MAWPAVVTDPYGNGLVLWTGAADGGLEETIAVPYSASPPAVSDVAVEPDGEIELDVSEPVKVALTVRIKGRRSRKQVFTLVPSPRREQLRPTKRIRRMLLSRSTRRITLRARDAGPRYTVVKKTLKAKKRRRAKR